MKNSFFCASLLTLASGALLAGCVTINIYFPAAAAEKAADKIIEGVWQLKKPEEGGQGAPGADSTTPPPSTPQPVQPVQPAQPQN